MKSTTPLKVAVVVVEVVELRNHSFHLDMEVDPEVLFNLFIWTHEISAF
jgi:hypothetical protein